MTRPSEDDRAEIDRAFAAMIAGYHLTADRPVEASEQREPEARTQPAELSSRAEPDPTWVDEHPLFRFPSEPVPERATVDEPADRYVPESLPPLHPPTLLALLGWLGIGWAALVVLAAAFGARFPAWVGWVAVVGFLGGFAVLITQLPRSRPPDAGDGAVL